MESTVTIKVDGDVVRLKCLKIEDDEVVIGQRKLSPPQGDKFKYNHSSQASL